MKRHPAERKSRFLSATKLASPAGRCHKMSADYRMIPRVSRCDRAARRRQAPTARWRMESHAGDMSPDSVRHFLPDASLFPDVNTWTTSLAVNVYTGDNECLHCWWVDNCWESITIYTLLEVSWCWTLRQIITLSISVYTNLACLDWLWLSTSVAECLTPWPADNARHQKPTTAGDVMSCTTSSRLPSLLSSCDFFSGVAGGGEEALVAGCW